MNKDLEKTLVLGHHGMVGSAVVRAMKRRGLPPPMTAGRQELDCLDQSAVFEYIRREKPTCIVVAAAKVGGIEANRTQMSEFMYENLTLMTNIIGAAWRAQVPSLMFLGSSCIYPRMAEQPIREYSLLSGPLEPTNEGYAIAKIAGMKMCQYLRRQYGMKYLSVMPTNLYGPGDNYNPGNSHVLPALIRKFEEARNARSGSITLWGTGRALREFLHVDDLADAILFMLDAENPPDWVNVGSGEEVSIKTLAEKIRDATDAQCEIEWDSSHPDGTPRKLLDCSLINSLGWKASIKLDDGIRRTIDDFRRELHAGTLRQ